MGNKLSRLAETLIGSEIVKLGNEIKEKIRQGEKIYNYTIGDFDPAIFPIPTELEACIIESYRNRNTSYPPAEGLLDLRKAVAAFIQKNEGLLYNADEILIAAGGRPLIYALYRAIVDKGDKVIYAVPSWNNNHYVHFTEGEHVMIEATHENNFMPQAKDIQPHIKGASLLALCSPLNPTGTTFTKKELEDICELVVAENKSRAADEKKLYLMFDQMYWTLTFGETVHYDPVTINPAMREFTIFIDGISKVFAATGVRVGWAMGPATVLNKMKAINSHVGAWAPMAEQRAVANYLVQGAAIDQYLVQFKNEIDERLRRIHSGIQQMKSDGFQVDSVAPQAAIYLTVKFDLTGKSTTTGLLLLNQADVTSYLLDEAGLAIVPFYAFGANRNSSWYRLSVGTCRKEEIDEMLGAVKEAISKLK